MIKHVVDVLLGVLFAAGVVLLYALAMVIFSNDAQAAECVALDTGITAPLKWVRPVEREDGELLPLADLGGYVVYKHNTVNNTKCEITLNDNIIESLDMEVKPNVLYNVKMKAFDTGDRFSVFTNTITKIVSLDVLLPSPVDDLVVSRVSGDIFSFGFTDVTTFEDGSSFPDGSAAKYYLFDANGWVRDVVYTSVPFELTLTAGAHSFSLETSIILNGVETVSNRSEVVNVDNTVDIIKPPKTFIIEFVVPDGFRPVVTVVPE